MHVSCDRTFLLYEKGWGTVSHCLFSPCYSWYHKPPLFLPLNSQVISFPEFREKANSIIPYIKMLQTLDFSPFGVRRQTIVLWMLEIISKGD